MRSHYRNQVRLGSWAGGALAALLLLAATAAAQNYSGQAPQGRFYPARMQGGAIGSSLSEPNASEPLSARVSRYQEPSPPSATDVPPKPATKPMTMPMVDPEMAPAEAAPAEEEAAEEEEEEETCDPWRIFCQKECGWNFHGFAAGGIMANNRGPVDAFNGPVSFADRDHGQFNQLYAIFENTIDTEGCGWDFGGRIDLMYGSDYVFTMASGLETTTAFAPKWNIGPNGNPEYGLALPQFYAEVGYNDLSVKIGHFYTVLGYEVVPANGNFFYTHAYTMQYGEPFTHTGGIATYKVSDQMNLVGGFVNGWDHFDRDVDTGAGIAGFTWKNCDESLNVAWNIIFSPNEPSFAAGLTNRNAYSLVVSKTFGCDNKWQYVFQHDLGWQHLGNQAGTAAAQWYGVNQYLFYTLNDCWKFGTRVEWFRDDEGVRVSGLRHAGNAAFAQNYAGSFYEISLGANYSPTANITIRPEIRYDWFQGVGSTPGPFGDGAETTQLLYGLDAIVLF